MNLNIPKLDIQAESEGKWFDYYGDIKLKIAKINNDAYTTGAMEAYALMHEQGEDEVALEDKEEFMATLYSRYILKGWAGVVDAATDEEVPYTPDVGYQVLSNKAYKDMLRFIIIKAKTVEEFWETKTIETGEE